MYEFLDCLISETGVFKGGLGRSIAIISFLILKSALTFII